MRLGLVTAILEHMNFEEVIDFASAKDLDCVELACWPQEEGARRYAGVSHIDVRNLTEGKAEYIKQYAKDRDVEIAALAYYPKPLESDLDKRQAVIDHLKLVIKGSAMLGVNMVTTFIGRDQGKTVTDNLAMLEEVWRPIIDLAEAERVKIAIENCPMQFTEDEWPGGQNIMTSPANWSKVFNLLDSDYLGLNFDPSQCVWQQLDYIQPIYDFKEKTDARFGFVMDSSDHRLRALIYQFGGQDFFWNEEGTSYMTDDKSLEAVEFFYDININGVLPKSVWTANEDPSSMFNSGQIPAYLSGSWQIKDFSENLAFDWQAVYMPYKEMRATNLGGNFMVGFENGSNPEGGRDFIEWLYQPENYTQLAIYAGYMPALEGIQVEYEGGQVVQDAYDVINNEIQASGDIAGKQTAEGLEMSLKGISGHGGSTYADFITQYLNDEIDIDTVTKNQIENLNRDRLEQ